MALGREDDGENEYIENQKLMKKLQSLKQSVFGPESAFSNTFIYFASDTPKL